MLSSFRRSSLSPASPDGESPASPAAQGTGSMFASLRRASMSLTSTFRRGSSVEILPPVEKKRSTRSSVRLKGSPTRASIKRVDTVLMEPHTEHASLVLQQSVYRRTDRFKNLSSTWLAGGEKGALPEESSDEELMEQSKHKRKKGKAEVSETEIADFITGLRRNMKKPETQAMACEELSQRLAGRKQDQIESIIIEEAATTALEAAQEHPDDMQLHGAVCPLLADLMTFSKAAGGYPTPVAAAGAALTLQGYIRFHEKLEAEDQLPKVEQVFKRIAKELPVEDQLHIMDSVGDALPSFCAKMYKKAAGKKFQQEEVVRRHRLRNTAFGHLAWLRGHKLGSNLMPTWQVQKLAVEEKKKNFVDKGLPQVGGDVWYKCWVPNSQKEWCYKGSFVNEVRFLAESQQMDFFWVSMDGARKIFNQNPAFEEALMYHVVAVCTDDQRYLWSFSFVQFLTILMENTNYPYGQAHLSPEDFRAKYPKAKFPVPGHYPAKPKSQAMTIPVPVIVSRNLRPTPTLFRHATGHAPGDRDPPAPPPLPDRLPCPVPYEITEPWMCIFASELQKRDLGRLLEVQRRELAASRAAAFKDEDAETEAEQPEEEELEQDEEVDPAADERHQRRIQREMQEVPEDPDENDDREGDEEQELDLENEREDGEFDDGGDDIEEFGEEEEIEEPADEGRQREEGSKIESEFGDDRNPPSRRVSERRSARSLSFEEDAEPRRASRRQSKD